MPSSRKPSNASTTQTDTELLPLDDVLLSHKDDIDNLRRLVDTHAQADRYGGLLKGEDFELLAYRYLRDKNYIVEDALKLLLQALDIREELKMDQVADYDDPYIDEATPFQKLVKQYYPEQMFCGVSKRGLPLCFMLKGRVNISDFMANVSVEQYRSWLAYCLVNQMRHLNKLSRHQNKFLQLSVVVDAKMTSIPSIKYLPYFHAEAQLRQCMSPEILGETFIIDAPWFFNMIWRVVLPLLSKVTQAKIKLLNLDELPQKIDLKYIPTMYGGLEPAPSLVIPDPAKGMDEVLVYARTKKVEEKHAAGKDMSISWKFLVMQKDIGVEVAFTDAEGITDIISPWEKVYDDHIVHEGSYLTNRAGTLSISWDNSYSYFQSKTVKRLITEFEDLSATNGDNARYDAPTADIVRKLTH